MHERNSFDRRRFLLGAAGLAGLAVSKLPALETPPTAPDVPDRSARAPADPVSIQRCRTYELEALATAMGRSLDRNGGLKKLVGGKTVTVKLNITGDGRRKMAGLPAARTYQTHPAMVEVLCGLLAKAGAKRIVLVESYYRNREPEDILASHGWDVKRIVSAGEHRVSFEDTKNRGAFKDYTKLKVPFGGYVYSAYHLNRRYEDTDVFLSLAKLKNHITAGVTCAVKNLFGLTPTALYGGDAPNERTTQNRGNVLHFASRDVPAGVTRRLRELPPEIAAKSNNEISHYLVPRVTADVMAVRPIDLAIVDGIESVSGGEGPWCRDEPHKHTTPGVIVTGTNAVTTDTVCTSIMGYDPKAGYGKHPFPGANHLDLLARAGVGANELSRIEVRGLALDDARHEYHPDGVAGWVKGS